MYESRINLYLKALNLINSGYSLTQVSKLLGIPRSTLWSWIYEGKHPNRKRGKCYSLLEYWNVLKLVKEGYTLNEISRMFSIPVSTLKGWVYEGKKPKPLYKDLKMVSCFNSFVKHGYRIKSISYFLENEDLFPYISYLYGATLSDGSTYHYSGNNTYSIKITGERIFLERVNECVFHLVGRTFKIYPDKDKNRYIISITRKVLYELMSLGLSEMKRIIEHNRRTMSLFILGLVDGDGTYVKSSRKLVFRKTKWDIVMYSQTLLDNLYISWTPVKTNEVGEIHYHKGKPIIHRKNRLGWKIDAYEFTEKIGSTIKILKRSDLPKELLILAREHSEVF